MVAPQFLNFILNLVFPNVCGICNRMSEVSICSKCKKDIEKYKIIQRVTKFDKIKIKLQSEIYFDEQIYFYKYEQIIRKKMIEYKFGDKPYLYKMFAEIIFCKELIHFCKEYDFIIPVPIDKKRMKERGYNQTLLIAKEISMKLQKVKIKDNILYKSKNIISQSKMNSKQDRIENIKGAFKIDDIHQIKGKKIIVFDDIFTTGSTANECAKTLKQAGAKKVGIITIVRD